VIALDGVAKAYRTASGRKIVLEDATVEFAPGHNFGILGANGAGKSTLIRLLAGSEMPDRGTIRRHARVSFPLGFGGTFHDALCGRENVAFIARVYGAGLGPTIRFVEEFTELAEYFRYYGANSCNKFRCIEASGENAPVARFSEYKYMRALYNYRTCWSARLADCRRSNIPLFLSRKH
jgi:ABC-type multidrug transport system ATPase subunit